MKKPKITFVMPMRNCDAFVAESIRGLVDQSLKNIEIIIFDDDSEDGSFVIAKHYADSDVRVTLIQNKQQLGAAWCRNRGNQMAKADIICVADAGDIYHCNRAKVTYDYFKKFPKMDIFSTAVDVTDVTSRHLFYEFPKLLSLNEKPIVCHPTVGYRKKVTDKIKYRELTVHSDLYEAFLLDATKAGFTHGFKVSVYVRKREMPRNSSQRDLKEAYKFRRKIYKEFNLEIPEFLKGE